MIIEFTLISTTLLTFIYCGYLIYANYQNVKNIQTIAQDTKKLLEIVERCSR